MYGEARVNRPTRFNTRYYSDKQEKAVAKSLGGKQTANSGATKFNAGDVILSDSNFLIECKTCIEEKKSFAIKHDWLTKNKEEAFAMGKSYSALCFNYGDNRENYYIIDEMLFKQLLEYITNENS